MGLLVAIAIATFVVPAALLIAAGIAAMRIRRGSAPGSRLVTVVAFLAGASLGTLLLFGFDMEISVWLPLVLATMALAYGRLRVRRPVQAGWLLLGYGTPQVVAWLASFVLDDTDLVSPDAPAAALLVAAGAAVLVGLALIRRGDPAPAARDARAPAGQPGSRSIASIAEAVRGPSLVGPIGLPELAMLVVFVGTWFIVPLLVPASVPEIIRVAFTAGGAGILATEAYVRGMPTRSRRAFEAFSWLGEWELARVRELTGGGAPTSKEGAEAWLAAHPEHPEQLPIRIEILAHAERFGEARTALDRLATDTPWSRFEVAALRDLVDWRAGGDGDVAAMEDAAADIRPSDSDDRLRAEVTIAVALVRRRMADGRAEPGDAAQPLLDVRARLGKRADGQVGRALRPRLLPGLVVIGVVIAIASVVFGGPS
jgi:hypothetical protein